MDIGVGGCCGGAGEGMMFNPSSGDFIRRMRFGRFIYSRSVAPR